MAGNALGQSPGGDVGGVGFAEAPALLARREAALRDHETALADTRERFRRTEERLRRALAWTEQLAADRLTLLQVERDMRIEAEAALAAFMRSRTGRLSMWLHERLARLPRLRRGLRAVAARVFLG